MRLAHLIDATVEQEVAVGASSLLANGNCAWVGLSGYCDQVMCLPGHVTILPAILVNTCCELYLVAKLDHVRTGSCKDRPDRLVSNPRVSAVQHEAASIVPLHL